MKEQPDFPSPGPIDNSSLLNDNGDLKRDISEGQDFVLLPADIYDDLAAIYAGGPRISRQVISAGGHDHSQMQIELYPLKVLLYCEGEVADKVMHISRSSTLQHLHATIATKFHTTRAHSRLWIDISQNNLEMQQEAVATKPTKGRRMTIDVTDVDGGWRYLRGSDTSPASLGSLGVGPVRILVEISTSINGKLIWPRDKALNRWRYELRGGDMIDARDERGIWSEAEVVGAAGQDTGALTVHFRGWSSKFDRVIAASELLTRIDPLFTHTTDWRSELEIGDKIEYRVMSTHDTEARWVVADVTNIIGTMVHLKYKHGNIGAVATAVADINGEDIAELHTHIKTLPPTMPTTTEISNGYHRLGDMKSSFNRHREGTSLATGAVGLANLGNTCFMNAILQCLSASPPLLEAFKPPECRFRSQINVDNPLGMHGKLASAYGRLVADMWSGRYSVVVPDSLKSTIAEFRPQFGGYQQQDAQELLLFLLDGLHEDLNRITGSKPYVVKLESNKGGMNPSQRELTDDILSRESWRRFLLRNDSELTDHWFGLLRSQVTCTTPGCGRLSTTFDEYSSLSLPLPITQGIAVTVTVYPLPYGSPPLKVIVEADPLSSVSDLLSQLNDAVDKHKHDGGDAMETCQPDGFVVVENNTSDEDEYDMCTETTQNGMAQANGKSKETHMHICGLLSYQTPPRIFKTFSNKSLVRDATHMRDELVAFQTRHSVVAAPAYVSSGSVAVDVYFAVQKISSGVSTMYAGYNSGRWDLVNLPVVRVSYEIGVTTIGELRADVCRIVSSRVKPEGATSTFAIHFATSNAMNSMCELTGDEKSVIARTYDAIVCVWQSTDANVFLDKSVVSAANVIDTRSAETSGPLTVYKCIAKFLEREHLPEVETYYCSACKQHKAPIKKFDIWSLPDMVVLQLKRFRYVPGAYFVHRDKVSDFVDYPVEGLDLSGYVIGDTPVLENGQNPFVYDLVGVVEHIGGIGGGHYTATCKHPVSSKWYAIHSL